LVERRGSCNSSNGGSWAKYENIDMKSQGDKEYIGDGRSKMSFEDLFRKVEEKSWSAISMAGHDFAAFKSFRYQLEPKHCKPTDGYTNIFYIYTRPPGTEPPPGCDDCTIV